MTQEKALVTISCERKTNILADISTHETTFKKKQIRLILDSSLTDLVFF